MDRTIKIKSNLSAVCRTTIMRYLLAILVILLHSGCRSPQVAYQTQVCQASTSPTTSETVLGFEHATRYSIEQLVQIALTQNPRLKEARHRIASLKHRIPQELSLPDPMVNTTTHLSPVETAAGRQAFALGVSQKFVDVDRRATKAAMVNDEVRAAESEADQLRLEIAEKVRVASWQLLAIQETIRLTREDIESLAQIEEVILRQYEVKKSVSQQDVLNVQIEQSKVENQLADLLQKEKSYSARIARLVRLGQTSTFAITDSLNDTLHSNDVEQLIAQAQQTRPELASQMARVQRDRRKIQLANLQYKPDFTVGLSWIATSSEGISPVANGDDALLLGVGFNLPIHKNRIRAAACEATEATFASEAKLESIRDEIAEEVFDSVAKLDSTASTLALLKEDIIPKSERTLELSLEEYANAKTDYAQLIANWRALLKYRIAVANLQSQRMQLLSTLGRQVGQLEPLGSSKGIVELETPDLEESDSVETDSDTMQESEPEPKYGLLSTDDETE